MNFLKKKGAYFLMFNSQSLLVLNFKILAIKYIDNKCKNLSFYKNNLLFLYKS